MIISHNNLHFSLIFSHFYVKIAILSNKNAEKSLEDAFITLIDTNTKEIEEKEKADKLKKQEEKEEKKADKDNQNKKEKRKEIKTDKEKKTKAKEKKQKGGKK